MRTVVLTAALCALALVSPAIAEEKKHDKAMDSQAMMEEFKRLATPGEPHKLLTSLAGSWTTATKEWMEPGKPPMESTGTAELTPLLEGRYLQQEYSGNMMGQPYNGVGISGYDNLIKKYVTTWIDSMGTGIFTMEGTPSPDGKTITYKGSHPMPGGGQMTHRAVWTILDSNRHTFEMYGTHPGGKEVKEMEIHYTRKR